MDSFGPLVCCDEWRVPVLFATNSNTNCIYQSGCDVLDMLRVVLAKAVQVHGPDNGFDDQLVFYKRLDELGDTVKNVD